MSRVARIVMGAALAAAGVALAASILAPYASEVAGTDYSEYVYSNVVDDGGFPEIDWEALLSENPDVVGWVHVEGTPIDYPVVQARADDPQRYLSCSLDGSWNGHGAPYVDADCDGANSPVVLTYGHNMIDGSMYSAFAGFTDQEFFDEHREILFLTPEHNYRLEAVAAREVSAYDEQPKTEFASPAELTAYVKGIAASAQATGRMPDRIAQLFEFVCCSYGQDNGRTVVYSVEPRTDIAVPAK
ncbi:MAG: class B sortase [Eggerthellaceae bacterium]|nr:class B sortase [Eggerthellaceae bacterium]